MNKPITVWVDADACPNLIKEILFRAAVRVGVALVLVANHRVQVPPSPWIRMVQVPGGFDVADNHIAQHAVANDLVITSDIPLAAEAVAKGVLVITPRGEPFTRENVRQRLNMRDFMETMRSSGAVHGGPPALGPKEKMAFANALDSYLAKHAH